MVRGWLDRGVDGFRLDVFNAFLKAAEMPSNPEVAAGGSIPWDSLEHRHDKDQPELHDLLAEFRGIVDSRPDTVVVELGVPASTYPHSAGRITSHGASRSSVEAVVALLTAPDGRRPR